MKVDLLFASYKKVVELLLENGAKTKIPTKNKDYPIHIACESGQTQTVEFLLN